jgi:hypothetical protein
MAVATVKTQKEIVREVIQSNVRKGRLFTMEDLVEWIDLPAGSLRKAISDLGRDYIIEPLGRTPRKRRPEYRGAWYRRIA